MDGRAGAEGAGSAARGRRNRKKEPAERRLYSRPPAVGSRAAGRDAPDARVLIPPPPCRRPTPPAPRQRPRAHAPFRRERAGRPARVMKIDAARLRGILSAEERGRPSGEPRESAGFGLNDSELPLARKFCSVFWGRRV